MNKWLLLGSMACLLLSQTTMAEESRWQVTDRGTVIDTTLKLEWMQCSIGQQLTQQGCEGEVSLLAYDKATQMAQSTQFNNHTDWRLPNIDELSSIVDCGEGVKRRALKMNDKGDIVRERGIRQNASCEINNQHPKINGRLFPNTPAEFYWSQTEAQPHAHYSVYFLEGNLTNYPDKLSEKGSAVRLVRQLP